MRVAQFCTLLFRHLLGACFFLSGVSILFDVPIIEQAQAETGPSSELPSLASLTPKSLAVIYPDLPEPDAQVFHEILEGIALKHGRPIIKYPISNEETPEDSISRVKELDPDLLIALGKRGYRIAKRVYRDRFVAIGAVPIRPNGISGISLSTDPKVLFDTLQELAPDIRKVNVVFSQGTQWLVDIAAKDAKEVSLEFNAIEVRNIKEAVSTYELLLKNIDANREAIWLPDDNITAHEQVILPQLLEASWEQNLVLFSSTATHAKRGALFSARPDNKKLGMKLVSMITEIFQSQQPAGVIPLADVNLALNLRTAAHLGFDYPQKVKQQFHLTIPQ